jgi:hypothetical protein
MHTCVVSVELLFLQRFFSDEEMAMAIKLREASVRSSISFFFFFFFFFFFVIVFVIIVFFSSFSSGSKP